MRLVKHLLMVQWVLGSIPHGGPIALFLIPDSSQCSITGITKAVVCAIVSLEWCI